MNLHFYAPTCEYFATGETFLIGRHSLSTIGLPTNFESRFSKSFEQVAASLSLLPRMFFELDGSFLWKIPSESGKDQGYQIDGMLYDAAGRVQRVEVKGSLPYQYWQQLCASIGVQEQPCVVYLVDEQLFIDFQEFEKTWTNSGSGNGSQAYD